MTPTILFVDLMKQACVKSKFKSVGGVSSSQTMVLQSLWTMTRKLYSNVPGLIAECLISAELQQTD